MGGCSKKQAKSTKKLCLITLSKTGQQYQEQPYGTPSKKCRRTYGKKQ